MAKPSSSPLPSTVEWIEREAWLDLYDAAPMAVRKTFKLRSELFGTIPVLASPEIPIHEFNRSFMLDDTSQFEPFEAVRWLKANAAREFAFQLADNSMTSDLRAWATQQRFAPSGNGWSKLVKNLAFHGDGALPEPENLTFVLDPDPSRYGELVVGAFGLPRETGSWFAALVGRPNWTVMVAILDDEAVGSCALFTKDRWAWLGIDGTLEHARRRGVQTAMIQNRVRIARRMGALYLTAETGRPEKSGGKHTSRDNFRRNGFLEAYHRLNFQMSQ
ncbi:hypothetical protein GCM10010520_55720 [Rhizobium viscosum]|uniref:GNAT superfamily N-acetyltransferase n=1 Tax=Rhizobium viscosum TaxID=1673 RepID=A0ABR9IZI8_RHIVS|nr:GNAT family N-acetyltransferase [Rhizobium viscosum]MBE1508629.1 GNAT superfamily N-acetyltransferase [Rhizobium viscosum]